MITQKFRGSRPFLEGKPSFIIANGKIQFKELKKNKLDFDQLLHLLRSQGVFSIREVEYGVLETNGSVSVLKKSPYHYPTKKDLHYPERPVTFPILLILDGEVIEEGSIC